MDIDRLFETLTVKDLKHENIKTRTEIEKKKEELRFLVGERYRDIIDAADNIFNMKSCSFEITDCLKNINSICNKWDSLVMHRSNGITAVIPNDSAKEKLQKQSALAAQMKLLLNMSDLIWKALENNDFAEAAVLFNICRNMSVHSKFMNDKYKDVEVDMQVMFDRQWSSLLNMEDTIAVICRKYLRSSSVTHSVKSVCDCLVAIILVENFTLQGVLQDYLNCVETLIQDWFAPHNSYISTNKQLTSVTSIIMTTVSNIYQLFIDSGILDRLKDMSNKMVKHMDCTKEERIYQFLPDQIALFKPALKPYQRNYDENDVELMIQNTKVWLENIRRKYYQSFCDASAHLTTIKSISDTQNELKRIFIKTNDKQLSTTDLSWNSLEHDNSNEWLKIIDDIFGKKLKAVIEEKILCFFNEWSSAIEKFINTNEKLIKDNEFDDDGFFTFLWTDFSKDVFFSSMAASSQTVTVSDQSKEYQPVFDSLYQHFSVFSDLESSNVNKNCTFENLIVKFKCIRPEIHQITKLLNDRLYQMVNEATEVISGNEEFLWNLLRDCLLTMLNWCEEWGQKTGNMSNISLISNSTERNAFRSVVKFDFNDISTDELKVLIVAQSLRSIYEILPALQAVIMTSAFISTMACTTNVDVKSANKRQKSLRLPLLPGKRFQQQHNTETVMWNFWFDAISQLKNLVIQFIVFGSQFSITRFIESYFYCIKRARKSVEDCEQMCMKCDSISLSNAEADSNVSLILEVPTQCSWPMHELLLAISNTLSNFAVTSIPRNSIDGIRIEILKTVINCYNAMKDDCDYQDSVSGQKSDITLLFDLRFFLEIINAKAGITKEIQDQMKSILTEIENVLDPFDYQMMAEALHSNLIQSVAKSSTLYMLLSSGQTKRNIASVQKVDMSNTQHNMIDLAGCLSGKTSKTNVRFGMLPVSGYIIPEKSSKASQLQPVQKKDSANLSDVGIVPKSFAKLTDKKRNSNRSFYLGRLGSNWF